MSKSSHALIEAEVKPSHRESDEALGPVQKLHRVPLVMAKAKAGRAIEAAIGDEPDKTYGHEGLVSGLKSGEKVPDYLARIVADKGARRRFAMALLQDDTDVIITTTITVPHEKVG